MRQIQSRIAGSWTQALMDRGRRRRSFGLAAVAIAFFGAAAGNAFAATYTITDLGTIGGSNSQAHAINTVHRRHRAEFQPEILSRGDAVKGKNE